MSMLKEAEPTAETCLVSALQLSRLLHALVGPPHHIRELQATRAVDPERPIDTLIDQFNAQAQSRCTGRRVISFEGPAGPDGAFSRLALVAYADGLTLLRIECDTMDSQLLIAPDQAHALAKAISAAADQGAHAAIAGLTIRREVLGEPYRECVRLGLTSNPAVCVSAPRLDALSLAKELADRRLPRETRALTPDAPVMEPST